VQYWAKERGEQRRTSGVGVKVLKWATASVEEGIRATVNVGARGRGKQWRRETRGGGGPVGTTAAGDCGHRWSGAAKATALGARAVGIWPNGP
jgi:hypothetical protein